MQSKRFPIHTAEQTLWTGEVQAPFNLAGEPIDNSVTEEGEARVRALAESEVRKAQTMFVRRMKQDDGVREYECSPTWCGYDGETHCQNCGFAQSENYPI